MIFKSQISEILIKNIQLVLQTLLSFIIMSPYFQYYKIDDYLSFKDFAIASNYEPLSW